MNKLRQLDGEKVPRLSICIPTHNRAKYISIALDSIIAHAQDSDVEIVIIDNASTDDTENVVNAYLQHCPSIRYYRNELNIGSERNFLKGIDYATGEYCWLFGSDDAITANALSFIFAAMQENPDLIMAEAINCDVELRPTGEILKFLNLDNCTLNFADKKDILYFLTNATMHASLFCYISSMIIKRSRLIEIPINRSYIGSGYFQVSRALDILVRGGGIMRYLAHPIVMNRRNNLDYIEQFGELARIAERIRQDFDLRMFRRVLDDYFSAELEMRNQFKAFVRRIYGGRIESLPIMGIASVDKFVEAFRCDDMILQPSEWLLRPKVARSLDRFKTCHLLQKIFSLDTILHIGFRGGQDLPVRPVNERAIGVDIGYAGYDGTNLMFETESLDVVWSSYCLHQMSFPLEAIDEWLRVVKLGGFLVISCVLTESDSAISSVKKVSLAKFFRMMDKILSGGSCRIRHCAQTPSIHMGGREDLVSEIDLVLEKIPNLSALASIKAASVAQFWAEAIKFHQVGELEHAENFYQKILLLAPDNFSALHMLGVVYFQRNQLESAEVLLRRAIALNAGVTEVHYNLACVLRAAGRYSEARVYFTNSLAINPGFAMAVARLDEMNGAGV